jgi:hypothetical protein
MSSCAPSPDPGGGPTAPQIPAMQRRRRSYGSSDPSGMGLRQSAGNQQQLRQRMVLLIDPSLSLSPSLPLSSPSPSLELLDLILCCSGINLIQGIGGRGLGGVVHNNLGCKVIFF